MLRDRRELAYEINLKPGERICTNAQIDLKSEVKRVSSNRVTDAGNQIWLSRQDFASRALPKTERNI